jgi:hypothetical protein
VDVRASLAEIRAHQLRQDKLLMQLQIEQRDAFKVVQAQLRSIASLLSSNGSGADHV